MKWNEFVDKRDPKILFHQRFLQSIQEEKEIKLHTVIEIAHVSVDTSLNLEIEPCDDIFYLFYFPVCKKGKLEDKELIQNNWTVLIQSHKTCLLRIENADLYFAKIKGPLPKDILLESSKIFDYTFSKYSKYFYYNVFANYDAYGFLSSYASGSIVLRLFADIEYFDQKIRKIDRNKKIQDALDRIEKDFTNSISIKTLAKETGYSVYYFNRLFKEVMGITPYQYVLQRRLLEGKNLLLSTDLSVEEISSKIGFSNVESFYKAFKNEFLVTPKKYKEKKRK